MTKNEGNFLLKAFEVVGTVNKDGSRSLIVSKYSILIPVRTSYIHVPLTSRSAAARLMEERQEETSVKT